MADHETGVALFNLLEEIVIRRTRAFVRKAYPQAVIKGERVKWPERRLKTVRYDLESTYEGIYDKVVAAVEGLRLAPYQLETYKKSRSRAGTSSSRAERKPWLAFLGVAT